MNFDVVELSLAIACKDFFGRFGRRGKAFGGQKLDTVPADGVVACRDNDAPPGGALEDSERRTRRRDDSEFGHLAADGEQTALDGGFEKFAAGA